MFLKLAFFFRSEVLKRIGCWFESCRPWLRHFRWRWDTTHGSTPTTSSADALHLCSSLLGSDALVIFLGASKANRCLNLTSLTASTFGTDTLRHWHKIFGLGQWQDIEGKTDSTLACFRLSIYVPPKTDTHGELKSFMIIHGMASTTFFEMDFKHSFAAEIAKVRNAFIGFCSAAVSDTCWIPSPKTTTDSQYPGHSNPRQFICRFP